MVAGLAADERQASKWREGDNRGLPGHTSLYSGASRKDSSLSGSADHDFTQGLQHLPLVVLKVTVNLANTLLLHHPQLAVGFCDESGIVADDDDSFEERRENGGRRKEGPGEEGNQNLKGGALAKGHQRLVPREEGVPKLTYHPCIH